MACCGWRDCPGQTQGDQISLIARGAMRSDQDIIHRFSPMSESKTHHSSVILSSYGGGLEDTEVPIQSGCRQDNGLRPEDDQPFQLMDDSILYRVGRYG